MLQINWLQSKTHKSPALANWLEFLLVPAKPEPRKPQIHMQLSLRQEVTSGRSHSIQQKITGMSLANCLSTSTNKVSFSVVLSLFKERNSGYAFPEETWFLLSSTLALLGLKILGNRACWHFVVYSGYCCKKYWQKQRNKQNPPQNPRYAESFWAGGIILGIIFRQLCAVHTKALGLAWLQLSLCSLTQ